MAEVIVLGDCMMIVVVALEEFEGYMMIGGIALEGIEGYKRVVVVMVEAVDLEDYMMADLGVCHNHLLSLLHSHHHKTQYHCFVCSSLVG